MIRVAVAGCAGRMGKMLVGAVAAADDLQLSAANEAKASPSIGKDAGAVAGLDPLNVDIVDDLSALFKKTDVVVDFTTPDVTCQLATLASQTSAALVIGTTGLNAEQQDALREASKRTAIVWAPNMSVGILVLQRLIREAAIALGPEYDIEIVEAHHRHKQDAPSGTALALAEVLAEATAEQGPLKQRACYGRHGEDPRQPSQIGIHTVRGGDVVGDHSVMFCADGERLELIHRASSRRTFALGAIRAARWVARKPPGLYNMQDVLGVVPQ